MLGLETILGNLEEGTADSIVFVSQLNVSGPLVGGNFYLALVCIFNVPMFLEMCFREREETLGIGKAASTSPCG